MLNLLIVRNYGAWATKVVNEKPILFLQLGLPIICCTMIIRKKFILIFLFICSGISHEVYGQGAETKIDVDQWQKISLTEFNSRIDRAIELLETKQISEISDIDQISIIKCLNTVFMIPPKEFKPVADSIKDIYKRSSAFQRFSGGRYEALQRLADEKQYDRNLTKKYPDFIPDRGMGFYFKKLQIELYGTPHHMSMYNVTE
jgi:hypothetical protein